jgi:outer membrane protein OmpA-like peptidoglycan-associated protein
MKIMSKLSQSVIATCGLLALTACQTIDPYTGEKKTSNAATYGAIGAVVCGLIGASENSRRARNAAAGCGLIGAGIGAYMDAQEAELRKSLQDTGVGVVRDDDQIRLVMPGNITFATDSAKVQADFYSVLDSVALVLKKYKDTAIEVEGHTDSTGSLRYNMGLSEKRAKAVADYLAAQGISRSRLVAFGRGPMNPIASNDTAEGRAQNRRVEIRIRAIEQKG